MKTYSLVIYFFLLCNPIRAVIPSGVTNELLFKITYHNYHFGYVKAVQYAFEATTIYTILGKSEGDLFFKKITSENSIYTVFEKNELVKSTTVFKRNGKTLNNTHTTLAEGKYMISTVENTNRLIRDEINFTVALMYFQEPLGITNVYSEAWGKVLPLINRNNHYTFTIPDGTVCTFKYKDGVLVEVISQTIIGEIKFTKQ